MLGTAPGDKWHPLTVFCAGPLGCQAPSARGSAGAAVGAPHPPHLVPGLQQSIQGESKLFLPSLPPSLSKTKNLILVFTAPPRWINPFLASPSPGKIL